MHPFIKVSGDSVPMNRKKERLEFCDSIFELKERLSASIQVEDHGVKAQIWEHFDIKRTRDAYLKPLWWRAVVNPDIRRALLSATALYILVESIGITNYTVLVAYALLFPILLGWFMLFYLVAGSIADFINSIKTFVSRFQMPLHRPASSRGAMVGDRRNFGN